MQQGLDSPVPAVILMMGIRSEYITRGYGPLGYVGTVHQEMGWESRLEIVKITPSALALCTVER